MQFADNGGTGRVGRLSVLPLLLVLVLDSLFVFRGPGTKTTRRTIANWRWERLAARARCL